MVAADSDEGQETDSPEGRPGDFEALIREHQRMVHSLCFRMTGSVADADDLTQETFLQAYLHWAQFRAEALVSSWLYRIAVNRCLNWRKRAIRRDELHRQWTQEENSTGHSHAERSEQIQAALMKLTPEQRAAMVLTTYDGLSHAEAAKALGCAEATISWRLFAARRKLKKLLKDLEAGTEP